MKKFITSGAAILVLAMACKKNNGGYLPTTDPPGIKRWIVTTVAGEGSPSFLNGQALSATFHFPEDVVLSPEGTAYITDVLNKVIRKFADGQVSTFAGSGEFGVADGSGQAAKFKNPFSVSLDGNGNLYATDENDPRIRKISPAREVITYAGTEAPGFADGNANTAQFSSGDYLTADALGNLFVSDAANHRIRKINTSGIVTTIAGTGQSGYNDGNGAIAQFNSPGGIALDGKGNLYVVDRGNLRIRKISSTGMVSTIAGSGVQGDKDGLASEAQFTPDLRDIITDDLGNLYLTDLNRIRRISNEGVVSTIAGSTTGFKDGVGDSARFNYPNGLGIDSRGRLYVADLNNNRIRMISYE